MPVRPPRPQNTESTCVAESQKQTSILVKRTQTKRSLRKDSRQEIGELYALGRNKLGMFRLKARRCQPKIRSILTMTVWWRMKCTRLSRSTIWNQDVREAGGSQITWRQLES